MISAIASLQILAAAEGAAEGGGASVGIALGVLGLGILAYGLIARNVGLIAGVLVASGAHFGLLFGFSDGGGGRESTVEDQGPVIEIEMPEVVQEEIEPETIPGDGAEDVPLEFAPPMQADVPSTVANAVFTQRLQPPPPPTTAVDRSQLTVPVNRQAPKASVGNLIDIRDLDQQPQVLSAIDPTYPYDMKREGMDGWVTLRFIIDTRGNALDIYVHDSSRPEFEAAAIAALQKWRFRPGKKGGKTVNTKNVQQLITFSISKAK